MDVTHYPSLQRLAQLGVRLAAIRRPASATSDAAPDEAERLWRAVMASDWSAVSALSEQLAARLTDPADERLVRVAQKTCSALRRSPNSPKAKRQVKELLSQCREWEVRRRAS
jgi:hypothetical protein